MPDKILHTFSPVFNNNSRILILGTMPSPRSFSDGFYYGHPQNRFWKIISFVFNSPLVKTKEQKVKLLLDNNIALWDMVSECEREGASDSSIKNLKINDIPGLLSKSPSIRKILLNGKLAAKLFNKYVKNQYNSNIFELPSTSPANNRISTEKLFEIWKTAILNG